MNKLKYIFTSMIAAFALTGCDSLDIENLNSYDANLVWADEQLASAYVTNLYAEVFPNWSSAQDNDSEQKIGMPFYEGVINKTGDGYKKWDYAKIRLINEAILELEAGSLLEGTKNQLLGESYFMRAYIYSQMIFYHGGIPYIKVPQDKDVDDLYVKRNSTAECFQFLVEDLNKAISLLPARQKGSSYGRIDRCFALSYKAKVLLYKASPQFNPGNMYDNAFWKEAYTAVKEAYEFCVHNGGALSADYQSIWMEENGPEVIFAVVNENPNKMATGWEPSIRPGSVSRGSASGPPTWNFVRDVPMLDGKHYNDPTSKYYVATENEFMQKYWQNRDPRLISSIVYNGVEYPVAGKPSGYRQYTALGIADEDDCYGINPAAGQNAANNDKYSGFFILKGSDLSLTQDKTQASGVDFVLMRLAEVMLIYAEAANENGQPDVAISMLKQLRERAGIEAGADGLYGLKVGNRAEIRQAVLDERNIELCFEGHRFMDMRRTRNMMKLDKLEKFGVEAIAINADGTDMSMEQARTLAAKNELKPENFRYVKHQVPLTPSAEKQFVIKESFYFFPIKEANILENPNLEQNNTWDGTFNPTLE